MNLERRKLFNLEPIILSTLVFTTLPIQAILETVAFDLVSSNKNKDLFVALPLCLDSPRGLRGLWSEIIPLIYFRV
jgi:hypothetical protein